MKFCEKCGTQINDETAICPQCQTPISNYSQQSTLPKKKSKKMYFIIPLIVIFTALIAFLTTYYFILPNNSEPTDNPNSNSSTNNASTDNTFTTTTDDKCPASQYGNHDWARAKCTEPAQCNYCDAYRDDKLGQHSFYTDSDGLCDCSYCGILYDVYIASLEE